MKKTLLAFTALIFAVTSSYACTNYLITKGASTDGSTMISYAADSHVLYGELYHWSAGTWPEGSMLDVYEWDTGKFLGKIKQAPVTYNVVGNMNEWQVAIGETTYTGLSVLGDQPGAVVDYGSLMYIALQRSKSAREAIKIMTTLLEEYGYASTGESFSISDPNEVWIMELIGKGRTYLITDKSLESLEQKGFSSSEIRKLKKMKGDDFFREKEFKEKIIELLGKETAEMKYDKILDAAESTEKGAVWVARLVPDGYVCGHANQARITTFPLQDDATSISSANIDDIFNPEVTTVYAKDVISFAREKGLYEGDDKKFSFSDVYAPVGFGGARFCEIRVWTMFNSVKDGMDQYWDYVKGNIEHPVEHVEGEPVKPENYASNRMPLWIKPDKKVSVHDMMMFMRDHLEGTELDMRNDIGAGAFNMPYRWRPLYWQVDSVQYCNERATATQQTGFSFVTQSRNWLPNPIGGIFWFGVDDAASSVYVPMYCGITKVPESFARGNGTMMKWSDDAAFWVFNQVSNFAYTRYRIIHPEIDSLQHKLEMQFINFTPAVDLGAEELYNQNKDLAIEFLTDYSCTQGNNVVATWKEFYQYLFMKYMDGNIKTPREVPEGYKYYNPTLNQPGYGEKWYKLIVEKTGDQFKVIGGGH